LLWAVGHFEILVQARDNGLIKNRSDFHQLERWNLSINLNFRAAGKYAGLVVLSRLLLSHAQSCRRNRTNIFSQAKLCQEN
jgi:hypothetical protein